MIHDDGISYDPVLGQGHGGPKVAEMVDFSSARKHIIKRLMVYYDTQRQYLTNFN